MEIRNTPISKLETVEIVLGATPAAGVSYPFPRIPQLEGKKITSIDVIDSDTLAVSPLGNTVSSNSELGGGTLTLTKLNGGQDQTLHDVALNYFNRTENSGIRVELEPCSFDWENCFVRSTSNLLQQGKAVIIVFGYIN